MKYNHKIFLVLVAILALVSLPTPSASQEDNTTLPLTLPVRVISTNGQTVCPPNEVREMVRNETDQDIQNLICNTILPALCRSALCRSAQTQASPVASCSALPTYCSSGYHWVRSSNGTAVQVYCDLDQPLISIHWWLIYPL